MPHKARSSDEHGSAVRPLGVQRSGRGETRDTPRGWDPAWRFSDPTRSGGRAPATSHARWITIVADGHHIDGLRAPVPVTIDGGAPLVDRASGSWGSDVVEALAVRLLGAALDQAPSPGSGTFEWLLGCAR